jgi:hypothetical protein
MIDSQRLLTIVVEAGSLISAMAALVAGVIMVRVNKKFGTGILASGFKSISVGVFFIAVAILIDAAQSYVQISDMFEIAMVLTIIKEVLFVIGTYIIVIGSKKTGDKLESLTK